MGPEQSPAGGLSHVIQSREALLSLALLVNPDQLLETLVVDPRPPLAVHFELETDTEEEMDQSLSLKALSLWKSLTTTL